jgi:hypothetical protein
MCTPTYPIPAPALGRPFFFEALSFFISKVRLTKK